MPLSDHEQQLLQQMEQALYAEDPKFAEGLSKPRAAQMDRPRFMIGIGSVVLGLLLLVAGVATSLVPVGILGFLAMIGGSFVAYRAWNGKIDPHVKKEASSVEPVSPEDELLRENSPSPKSTPAASDESFMNRMEERWRKRKEDGDQPF